MKMGGRKDVREEEETKVEEGKKEEGDLGAGSGKRGRKIHTNEESAA